MSRLKLFLQGATRSGVRSWSFIAVLVLLCAILAVLQYRWIGEITVGERERLKTGLDNSLRALVRDFNYDISSSLAALLPAGYPDDDATAAFNERFTDWLETTRHPNLFRKIAYTTAEGELRLLDPTRKKYLPAPWPEAWLPLRESLPTRGAGAPRPGGGPPFGLSGDGLLIALPHRAPPPPGEGGGPPNRRPDFDPGRFLRNADWLIVELDLDYLRDHWMPALIEHHLGRGQYEAEITSRQQPEQLIAALDASSRIGKDADASVALLELTPEVLAGRGRRGGPRGGGFFRPGGGGGPDGPGPGPFLVGPGGRGRWLLAVRNKAGSLETIIQRARWRNLGVSLAVLALVVATAVALVRYSRRAERLAQLQMDFVAGISHELRTPLTVIRMAAYNLKGKIAQNPAQVEKYGNLIQAESERLTAIVEQVLRFAASESGKAQTQQEPVNPADLIAHSVESCRSVIQHARVEVEQHVAPTLPVVLGDNLALQHALQNLITNAVKYGTDSSNWIGVYAEAAESEGKQWVEIRIADRGPGIPEEEQQHLFDPFFRGRRAMQDQIHGTGLGLNLVKKIVDAHGGTVNVRSAAGKGTEFVIRIPVAPAEYQDEFAHSFG